MAELKKLDKYEIIQEIGRGGFAVVYRAHDTRLGRTVALKVLAPHLTWDPHFAARFKNEAQTAARLRHPNIVTIYDVDEESGQLYIAMECLEGKSLDELLRKCDPLSLSQTVDILAQVADALDYAHRQGVLHRDVKPANIMVETRQGRPHVTLMDFGLVKMIEGNQSLTSMGTTLGSPKYMAPEQADSARKDEVGPAADLYALGVVAYEMLTGRVPFDADSLLTVLHDHANTAPPDPQKIRADLPAEVAKVLLKALSKAPSERYPTAMAFVEALCEAVQPPDKTPDQNRTWLWLSLAGIFAFALLGGGIWLGSLIASRPTPTSTLGIGSTRVSEKDGMVMIYVPAGAFQMGGEDGQDDEKPVRTVTLDAFWIDRTEVTNAMFAVFLNDQGNQIEEGVTWLVVGSEDCQIEQSDGQYRPQSGYEQHPVSEVTWYGANAYCRWASRRLPTEAEWEKAARGTDERTYPWGNTFDGRILNFCDVNCPFDWKNANSDDRYNRTAPVGSYPAGASPYGALDMAGNIWEWVADWYDANYYASSPVQNPAGSANGSGRVLRGGSWYNSMNALRAADRDEGNPSRTGGNVGFRCVRSGAE